jgi:hypothetical protein
MHDESDGGDRYTSTAHFAGLTVGGAVYDAEQGRAIIQYAKRHGIAETKAARILAEINGWPRPSLHRWPE